MPDLKKFETKIDQSDILKKLNVMKITFCYHCIEKKMWK